MAGRCILQANGHAGAVGCPGVAAHMKRRSVSWHGSARPSMAIPPAPAGFCDGPRIPGHASDLLGLAGTVGHWDPGASGSVNRFLARAIRPRDRAHDRGRCPLYVRAQLDTVGLSWTQRDLVRLKATARETGKTQLTGHFRR